MHTKNWLASMSSRKRQILCKNVETTSNLWKCCGVQRRGSSNALSNRQRVRLHLASGLIQGILNLATSPLLGLPFTPTLIQSGWTRSPAAELLKLTLRLGVQWLSLLLITPGHRRGLRNSHQLPRN